jgi:phosphatidylserine decarboxylase
MKSRGIIAKEGRPFIAIAFVALLAAFAFGFPAWVTVPLGILLIFTVAFFRDPHRLCPGEPNEILSPADGTIVSIRHVESDRFLESPTLKVDIFMSPFNVHVNRFPLKAEVEESIYNPGKYLNAASEKASLDNEQNALILKLEDGRRIAVNQIAGLIARRIVCRVKKGDRLGRGERFGLIRFGSRVDVHLPPDTKLTCEVGDKVFGGDTILGVLSDE